MQEIEENHSLLHLLHDGVQKLLNKAGKSMTLILIQVRLSEKGEAVQEMVEDEVHLSLISCTRF